MIQGLWIKLDALARKCSPFAITLVLVLFSIVPAHIPGYARIAPLFPLMAVYHWAVNRPELLPAIAVFTIGLLVDTLGGTPIGVNALVFLAVYGVVVAQRRFLLGKPFWIAWLGFALTAAVAALQTWVLLSLFETTLLAPQAIVFQYLTTLGCFPILAWILLRWQRAYLRRN